MKRAFFTKKTTLLAAALLTTSVVVVYSFIAVTPNQDLVTTTIERGTVQDIVSVSGFVEAKNTAHLSFPVTGIVTDVFIEEGALVKKGELLATLGSSKLVAQRAEAVASLQKDEAARDELLTGPTDEARVVTNTTVISAKTSLANILATEAEKVANAWTVLLSNNLRARAIDSSNSAAEPVISGSYNCVAAGVYRISIYNSAAKSGYSYTVTGLEDDLETAFTDQPGRFGNCGLTIQFTAGSQYANTDWTIEVPNTKSSTYVISKNAYDLAIQQQEQNVQTAKDAFALATDNATLANASPSNPALRQATASVDSAQARIAQIDAQIREFSIVAPFDGVITDVDVLPGETAGAAPVITLLSQDAFELKARIPEIDILKITAGQKATIVFDAQSNQTLTGTLAFISPLATEIDGVAYFNTTITLDETPEWVRSGFNADIDIIIKEASGALKVSKRFVTNNNGVYSVRQKNSKNLATTTVEILLEGNDGFFAITGLTVGDIVIAPE
jgi:multidrug resistance efflux pump